MKSLDPRIRRLQLSDDSQLNQKESLDQLETFQVFVQVKENRSYQHEGIVHAPSKDLAFLFGKEQYSRRGTCTGLAVARTENVFATRFTENAENVYDQIPVEPSDSKTTTAYEVFHLYKRGKQHKHAGRVEATSPNDALVKAGEIYNNGKPVLNIWIIKSDDLLFTSEEDRDIWQTLSEKQFRDAIAYKALDKLKAFKNQTA